MSLVEAYHAEHKTRLYRMGGKPKPAYVPPAPVIRPINPEPYYAGMWFFNLITLPSIADKIRPIGRVQSAVARHFNISVEALTGRQQSRDISRPRQIAYYLVRRMTTKSTHEIARRFNRDHSSVIHGIRNIERRMRDDAVLAEQINHIRARLHA